MRFVVLFAIFFATFFSSSHTSFSQAPVFRTQLAKRAAARQRAQSARVAAVKKAAAKKAAARKLIAQKAALKSRGRVASRGGNRPVVGRGPRPRWARQVLPPVAPRVAATPIPTATPRPTPTPTLAPTPTPLPLQMFPFALPSFDASKTATDISWLNKIPAGANGFISAKGEHFVDGQGNPIRFWGVNINFAGAFPARDEAPKIAARLAKFGFNAVRLHHYEGYPSPSGLWKAASLGSSRIALPREIDPEQLDRFDFFIAQLIKSGIYINLNLHVGRKTLEGEGLPNAAKLPEKDKGVNYYDSRLIELQQEFARTILTRVNPHTGRALKDEPGLCAVEVANENSLLGAWLDGTMSKVVWEHSQPLQTRWNEWLRQKYPSETRLRAAWTEINEPVGITNLLTGALPLEIINPDAPDARIAIAQQTLSTNFQLATVTGATGTVTLDRLSGPTIDGFVRPGLTVDLQRPGTVSWAFQLNRDGLELPDNHPHTLTFWGRADSPRQISVNLWQDRAPNRFLGFTGYANLTSEWKQFSFVFRPLDPEPNHSRISWNLGNKAGVVQLGEMDLRLGGRIAAPEDWTLSRGVPLLDFKSTPVWVVRRDFAEFLSSIEAMQVKRMRDYLKTRLGIKVPIWHTQAQFGGWGGVWRESQSDAIDVHAYWKHPDFGGNGWNGATWKVENATMTNSAGVDPLSAFSLARVEGKPFVMTEWNSGQPNDYGGESLIMAAAYAAWQDWASVYVFDYHSAGPYSRDKFEGFFSIDSHPVKMATAPAAALIYRRPDRDSSPYAPAIEGDVARSEESVTLTIPRDSLWHEVANAPGPPTAAPLVKTWSQSGAARTATLQNKTYVRFDDSIFATATRIAPETSNTFSSDTRQIKWHRDGALWTLNAPKSKSAIGQLGGKTTILDEWRITMPPSQNNWASFSLSSLDGEVAAQSKRMLLTVVGRAENMKMGWNAERNSVGSNWGEGPTRVEGISAEIELLSSVQNLRVWALDKTGARNIEVPVTRRDGKVLFFVGPNWQTLWYEIGTA